MRGTIRLGGGLRETGKKLIIENVRAESRLNYEWNPSHYQ